MLICNFNLLPLCLPFSLYILFNPSNSPVVLLMANFFKKFFLPFFFMTHFFVLVTYSLIMLSVYTSALCCYIVLCNNSLSVLLPFHLLLNHFHCLYLLLYSLFKYSISTLYLTTRLNNFRFFACQISLLIILSSVSISVHVLLTQTLSFCIIFLSYTTFYDFFLSLFLSCQIPFLIIHFLYYFLCIYILFLIIHSFMYLYIIIYAF